jgi:hypothetical protein
MSDTIVLYRDGEDWKHEEYAASKRFECTSTRICAGGKTVIARFSALPFYRELERDLGLLGSAMINTYDAHRYLTDICTWHKDLFGFTPMTGGIHGLCALRWEGLRALPITRECRFFVHRRRILCGAYYWAHTGGKHTFPSDVPGDLLSEIIDIVQSTTLATPPVFYSVDVAKTASGDWVLMSLDDGQMAPLFGNCPDTLYTNLRDAIENPGGSDE